MKHLYLLDYVDTVAADNEEQALDAWAHITGESVADYPNMDIHQVPNNEWVTIWIDDSNGRVSRMASRWARETKQAGIVCSTEW